MNLCKIVALLGVVANAGLGANALGIREDAALTVASAVDMLAGVDTSVVEVAVDAKADLEVGAGCGTYIDSASLRYMRFRGHHSRAVVGPLTS